MLSVMQILMLLASDDLGMQLALHDKILAMAVLLPKELINHVRT